MAASLTSLLVLVLLVMSGITWRVEGAWCVARSNASQNALQAALDYACGAGADCAPIMSSGLCFLPNTIEAHASYAFNSYYQRKSNAPGSCDFSGTATVATTDPSYGSCVYPPTPSSAGGGTPAPGIPTPPGTIIPNTPPTFPTPFPSGLGPPTPGPDSSRSPLPHSAFMILYCLFISFVLLICQNTEL